MLFHKNQTDNEDVAISFLRGLDKKAYTQFIKAIDIYREGDAEMDKFRGKNINGDSPDFLE